MLPFCVDRLARFYLDADYFGDELQQCALALQLEKDVRHLTHRHLAQNKSITINAAITLFQLYLDRRRVKGNQMIKKKKMRQKNRTSQFQATNQHPNQHVDGMLMSA